MMADREEEEKISSGQIQIERVEHEKAYQVLRTLERLLGIEKRLADKMPLQGKEANRYLQVLYDVSASCFMLQREMMLLGFSYESYQLGDGEFWAEFERDKEPRAGGQCTAEHVEVAVFWAAKRALTDLEGS